MGHMKYVKSLIDNGELLLLESAYKKAIKEKKNEFYYNNQTVLVEYAGHLINYMKEYERNN